MLHEVILQTPELTQATLIVQEFVIISVVIVYFHNMTPHYVQLLRVESAYSAGEAHL